MRRLIFFVGGLLGLNIAVIAASPGCGNTIIELKPGDSGGGGTGGDTTSSTGGIHKDGGGIDAKDALADYVDPGCPDAGPKQTDFQCDPYHQNNGDCMFGDGCYISVQYPDEPCAQEIYGSFCAPAGTQQQGDPCNGGPECAAGLVCVITGFGTQCVQLCPLTGPSGCPDGLTCAAIDVEGYGGCF
jgi:hypothetical protein